MLATELKGWSHNHRVRGGGRSVVAEWRCRYAYRAFIGGQWVDGDGEEIEVVNPSTGDVIGTVVSSTVAQVDQAVQVAKEAWASWRKTAVLERVDLCRHAFTLCEERLEEMSEMICLEVGKPIRDSREMRRGTTSTSAAASVLETLARCFPDSMETSDRSESLWCRAVGVVAAISPSTSCRHRCDSHHYGLALGTVVWKPSNTAVLLSFSPKSPRCRVRRDDEPVNGRGDAGSASSDTATVLSSSRFGRDRREVLMPAGFSNSEERPATS
jgi:hypothetical protein